MKRIVTIILITCLICSMVGCGTVKEAEDYTGNTGRLLPISEQQDLYYDVNTNVVYIIFNKTFCYAGYGYMSPYFADNGMPYLYENGGLVKIE